ncbi:hypothetical protein AA313_de0200590 [Arthrobotrys entomopaga]|nr:hypothetical protein AA313_de0200590 [Arthrobotrys entomopaga]
MAYSFSNGYDGSDDNSDITTRFRNFTARWLQPSSERHRQDFRARQIRDAVGFKFPPGIELARPVDPAPQLPPGLRPIGPKGPGPAIEQISNSGPANPGPMTPSTSAEPGYASPTSSTGSTSTIGEWDELRDVPPERNPYINHNPPPPINQTLTAMADRRPPVPPPAMPPNNMAVGGIIGGPFPPAIRVPTYGKDIGGRSGIPAVTRSDWYHRREPNNPLPQLNDDTMTYNYLGPTTRSFFIPQSVIATRPQSPARYYTREVRGHMKKNVVSDLFFFLAVIVWIAAIVTFAVINSKSKKTDADNITQYSQNKAIWGLGFTVLAFMIPTIIIEVTRPWVMRVLMVLRHEQEKEKFGRYLPFYSIGMTRAYPVITFVMMASLYGLMVYLYLEKHAVNEILIKECAMKNGTVSAVASTIKSIASAAPATLTAAAGGNI